MDASSWFQSKEEKDLRLRLKGWFTAFNARAARIGTVNLISQDLVYEGHVVKKLKRTRDEHSKNIRTRIGFDDRLFSRKYVAEPWMSKFHRCSC